MTQILQISQSAFSGSISVHLRNLQNRRDLRMLEFHSPGRHNIHELSGLEGEGYSPNATRRDSVDPSHLNGTKENGIHVSSHSSHLPSAK